MGTLWALLLSVSVALGAPPDPAQNPSIFQRPPEPIPQEKILQSSEERVRQTQLTAHVLRRKKSEDQISGLEIFTHQVPLLYNFQEGKLKPTVEVRLGYRRPGWTAFHGAAGAALLLDENGEGSVFVYLRKSVSELEIVARGPEGQIEKEKIYLYAPEVKELAQSSPWNKILLSLGGGIFEYYQTAFGRFRSGNAVAAVQYAPEDLWGRFSLIGRVDMTFATFYSTPIWAGPQMIEAHLDASYDMKIDFDARLRWYLLAGTAYTTLFSNGSPFGFSNLVAPEAGARVRVAVDPLNFVNADFRFMPLAGGSLGQRGYQLGLTWSRLTENLRRVDLGLEYSALSYEPDDRATVQKSLWILKLGYSI